MFEKTKIRSFLKNLKSLNNIELYLYTSLSKSFAESVLKKIGIDDIFPSDLRRYCEEEERQLNEKKHPTWIDHNTRRVIILTPNKEDVDDDNRKYFLILNRIQKNKLLRGTLSLLKQLLSRVNSVDELHT